MSFTITYCLIRHGRRLIWDSLNMCVMVPCFWINVCLISVVHAVWCLRSSCCMPVRSCMNRVYACISYQFKLNIQICSFGQFWGICRSRSWFLPANDYDKVNPAKSIDYSVLPAFLAAYASQYMLQWHSLSHPVWAFHLIAKNIYFYYGGLLLSRRTNSHLPFMRAIDVSMDCNVLYWRYCVE